MMNKLRFSAAVSCWGISLLILVTFAAPWSSAATFWTGPNITYTKSGGNSDTVLAGKVVLKRNNRDALYNTAAGETAPGPTSPKDTLWAFGNIANATTLTYQSLESLRNGNLAARILNQPMVVHIINEDIYFSIKFTTWGQFGSGTVSYTRSTPAVAVAPTVSITSPSAGANFTAPASIALTANAAVTGGTVSSVQYFAGSTSLGSATVAPFSVTGNIAAPGSYALTAVATAGGVSATSAVVNITVTAAPQVSVAITSPAEGAIFAAPANVSIAANATATGGTVDNVSFYNQATLLGSARTAPFTFAAKNLAAGAYSLTAVATASGVSSTSGVVHITIVSPVDIALSSPAIKNGTFSFSYTANPGLTYVVQRASTVSAANTLDWTPVQTNTVSSSPASYSENGVTSPAHFFRVARLPNP